MSELVTLLLDCSYLPNDIIQWRDAMTLWSKDRVDVLAEYPDRVIHRGLELYVPCVVRLRNPINRRWGGVKFNRANLYRRDRGRCQYCGVDVPFSTFEEEHVIPRAQGGKTGWDNIVAACHACNQYKADRTPEQAGMRLLTKPGKPRSLPPAASDKLRWHANMPEDWRPYLEHLSR